MDAENSVGLKPLKIVGLNYVSVYARDLEAAKSFYTAVFGPPPARHFCVAYSTSA